jgi:hypothetical protein
LPLQLQNTDIFKNQQYYQAKYALLAPSQCIVIIEESTMGSQTLSGNFKFVNATVTNPSASHDPAVRALIRKQAMKKAASTRRRGGNYGKHNLRQYPVFYQSSNDGGAAEEVIDLEEYDNRTGFMEGSQSQTDQPNVKRNNVEHGILSRGSIPPKPSANGFELVTMKNNFDIIDLSTLATYHVGRATAEALSSDPLQLLRLLDLKQWSYMSYLLSLYGSSACLDDAIDCIIARVRHVIAPNIETGKREVIRLYLTAIDSLQKAPNSPSQRLAAHVLCATEILALYEVQIPPF